MVVWSCLETGWLHWRAQEAELTRDHQQSSDSTWWDVSLFITTSICLSFIFALKKTRVPDQNIGRTNLFHTLEFEKPTLSHECTSREALTSLAPQCFFGSCKQWVSVYHLDIWQNYPIVCTCDIAGRHWQVYTSSVYVYIIMLSSHLACAMILSIKVYGYFNCHCGDSPFLVFKQCLARGA